MASRLFVCDDSGDELWEIIDPDGSTAINRTLPATLTHPQGMTVFNGRLLVADDSGDELWELDPDGADGQGDLIRNLPSVLSFPVAMTAFNGRLLVLYNSGELWELDPDGADGQGEKIRDLPGGLAFFGNNAMTAFNGRLLVNNDTNDELWELDPDGADTEGMALREFPSALTSPQGMTVFNGRLLVADDSGDELWELDPDGADTEGERIRDLPNALTSPLSMAAFNTVDHAVDAGSVSFAFDLPEPTVTHTPAPASTLATSDWDDTGYQAPIVLALLPATISGADITVDPVTAIDGDLVVASDLTIDGVERIGIGIRLRRTGTARLDFYFDDAGSPLYPDAKAFIVIDDTARTQIPFSIAATAGGFNNWQIDDAAQQALITAIATGDRFVLAIAEPATTTTDHAVDAGAVAFAFDFPQPSVTHTPAAATVDHAVDAGPVHFAFALPQPAVTHTPAVPTTVDHAVDAGAVAWAFHLPEPSVTHSLPTGLPTWAQYAITIQTNPISRFWTGRGRLDYQGDLFEGGGRAVGVGEVELVSGNPDRRLTITLSSIPPSVRAAFLQDVGAVEVEVALIFSTDKGATWRSAPLSYSGRLSSPTMVSGRLTVELETLRGDVDHGEVRYWSHEDQERRFPGDKGCEYMRQLAGKGTETGWPP